ncbi:polycomb group RING finger protein 3-like [Clytia hemisphaerica]|uniref:RING-type domain-containing protein n=1 Tax=Clytia hemisphaerica TaxID=252671 RepID=A0A7M5X4R8_9CNID|eukprot:TCONS_00022572-protein
MVEESIKVKELNDNFTCIICNGYLIRPVAITECLHYFCRSCIVKYLETTSEYKCPYCETLIHETNPWELLREDKKLEYIIYQLVPGLAQNEKKRRKLFYSRRGMVDPDENNTDSNLTLAIMDSSSKKEEDDEKKNEKEDEKPPVNAPKPKKLDSSQIGLHLNFLEPEEPPQQPKQTSFRPLDKPYLRTSSHITIAHLKKFLQKKLEHSSKCDVDILCNGELMGRHHTLEFIYMTRWRYKEGVLKLDYRPKVDIS